MVIWNMVIGRNLDAPRTICPATADHKSWQAKRWSSAEVLTALLDSKDVIV